MPEVITEYIFRDRISIKLLTLFYFDMRVFV